MSDEMPTADDFHFSSIDAMYRGQWVNGLKHDQKGVEYSNYGVYTGAFVYNVRDGHGDKLTATFDTPRSRYKYTNSKDPYPKSLFPPQFQDGGPHGNVATILFADGATVVSQIETLYSVRNPHIKGQWSTVVFVGSGDL
ncbi:hypothetical protein DYB36_009223 [Aphanomyces astaci]|uniref:Uncharacterized protein n=1 Tax=Aphanomyces astaci TaxID=112090 RepID=A0A397A172_APHAT|nr:hypothetical protein DYB36_009223 [Aphanomyces astaci]